MENLDNTNFICDGCKVRGNWEHRCHGKPCKCKSLTCMAKNGQITYEEMMYKINKELAQTLKKK